MNCLFCNNALNMPGIITLFGYVRCQNTNCTSYKILYEINTNKQIIEVHYEIVENNKIYAIAHEIKNSSIYVYVSCDYVSVTLPLSNELQLILTPSNFAQKIKTILTFQ